ncbi:TetR/AcrR family transcriptional regulator [Saccharopolyspora sp. 5N708]|uniref:TetR/AcrR family transcriptional regulator n=1 Tax=Saccharopolyspora sp. 5N708 TaxID=3457424 RepID=UPI003FD24E74
MGTQLASNTAPRRGGRGARERILETAVELFYDQGIHATGVAQIAEVAHVSIRTLYQHFKSKNDLVAAYLRRLDMESRRTAEQQVLRTDLTPRDRLLAIFDRLEEDHGGTVRGCPFHNAAVEAAGAMPEVARLVAEHKETFRQRLIEAAGQAGATNPERLGRHLAVLFEGATALSTSCDDKSMISDARSAAVALIDAECPA